MSTESMREAVKEALANGQPPKPEQPPAKEEYLSDAERQVWREAHERFAAVQRSLQVALDQAREPLLHLTAAWGPKYGFKAQDHIDAEGRIVRAG